MDNRRENKGAGQHGRQEVAMYKKHGKFVARWTAADGSRHIKVFRTAHKARLYANHMRRIEQAKKAQANAKRSRRSRRPGRKTRRNTSHTGSSPARSSRQPGT
jgi:hypothetical protein